MRKETKTRNNKTEQIKDIISIILPLTAVFITAITIKTQPTGFAVYEGRMLYRINGSVSISLQEKIPVDSYIRIRVDGYEVKVNFIEFLDKAGKGYEMDDGFVIGNGVYKVKFVDLGIVQGFEKGNYKIITEVVHENLVLYRDKAEIEI